MTKTFEESHIFIRWAFDLALEGPFCLAPINEVVAGEGLRHGLLDSIDGRHWGPPWLGMKIKLA